VDAPISSTGPVAASGPVTMEQPRDYDPYRPGIQHQGSDPSLGATTTFQEDLTTAGQRRVNLIWEWTQSFVTVIVVMANMIVAVVNAIRQAGVVSEHPAILSSALFLILGFYYSRTNHAAIGGVGTKPLAPYVGR
jgi:hypothetical protein